MKKRWKTRLLLLLSGVLSLFLLGGCSLGATLEETIEKLDAKAHVTYYANGGEFESDSKTKEMYYQENTVPLNIGAADVAITSGTATVSRNNYDLVGWCYAVLDADGNPQFEDETNGLYKLGADVDFSKKLQAGDRYHFIAKWQAQVEVKVRLVFDGEAGETISSADADVSYANDDVVAVRVYNTEGKVVKKEDAPFAVKDKTHTFLNYYADKECTTPVSWPIVKQEGQTEDVNIYAKYIKGDWTMLRVKDDVRKMFTNVTAGSRYYLTQDIDVNGLTVNARKDFNGELQGNGYAIQNLAVQKTSIPASDKVSMFGDIGATAVIENVSFTGLKIEYTVKTEESAGIYFVCTSIADGATITNVKLSGTMRITISDVNGVANIKNGDYTTSLYGGYTNAEYTGGFTVEGNPEEFITIKK